VVCKGDHGVGRGYRTSLASPMRPCPGAKTGLLCSRGAPAPPAPHDGIGARRLRHQRGMSQQLGHPTSGPNVAQDRGLMMPCAYEPRPPAYEPDSMGPRGGWAKQGRATLSAHGRLVYSSTCSDATAEPADTAPGGGNLVMSADRGVGCFKKSARISLASGNLGAFRHSKKEEQD
jgi:hypothetical protein